MEITIAKNAGFCFGVKRATDSLEAAIADKKAKGDGRRLYTLGTLIHNETYNEWLTSEGVGITQMSDVDALAKSADKSSPVVIFVRAHGIPRQDEEHLQMLCSRNPCFSYVDCTCPYVKKIHRIAQKHSNPENMFLLLGGADHPEVVGILSYFDYEKHTFASAEELEQMLANGSLVNLNNKVPVLAAQTTQKLVEWQKTQKILQKLCTNPLIFDTICSVTEQRQTEAAALAASSDAMVVIGGRESSNTAKLYAVCKENCPHTVRIERADELAVNNLITHTHAKVGIAAGASTPSGVIQEVYNKMSEKIENFEQMLEESFKTLNTGDIVNGIVTLVTDAELQLDVGAQVTGIIRADQITDDPSVKLTELYKKGDTVEARVFRVSDIEGIAELSKKAVDSAKNWQKIVEACENGTVLTGKVVEVIKGGVNVLVDATKIFVPASQTGVPKDGDLNSVKGNTVELKVIEIGDKKRAIGSIRVVAREQRKAQEEAFWASVEEGKVYTGVVKSMTAYGAFVDLGGVDGMVHKTELSWRPIATPAAVVSVGQEITVFVKSFDAEKKRISLGYKTDDTNPWYIFMNNYAIGDVVSVKIVSLMPFGAFAEICDGVDGLIHISQIAQQKIGKPADVLELGQVVDAKIVGIDEEKQQIALSIRALLDEAQAAAEAMPEDAAEEATDAE